MLKSFVLFCMLAMPNIINAQYRVEKIEINGELTEDDPFESKFGRFDGVELYLNKGDVLNISLNADFNPFIALVAPSEKYYVKYSDDGRTISNYLKSITESGTWFLSIASDSAGFGKYEFSADYIAANSVTIPSKSDYCTVLNYLAEHSKIDFNFVKKERVEKLSAWIPKYNLTGALNNEIISSSDSIVKYKSIFFESDNYDSSLKEFNGIISNTGNCIGTDWVSNLKEADNADGNDIIKEMTFALKDKLYTKKVVVKLVKEEINSNKYWCIIEIFSSK